MAKNGNSKTERTTEQILASISADQAELDELESDDRPDEDTDIKNYTARAKLGYERGALMMTEFHKNPERLIPDWADPTKGAEDLSFFPDPDRKVEEYARWRRGPGAGGMRPARRAQEIAIRRTRRTEHYVALRPKVRELPDRVLAHFPPPLFLDYEPNERRCLAHANFLWLKKFPDTEYATSIQFSRTSDQMQAEISRRTEYVESLKSHAPGGGVPKEQMEDAEAELADALKRRDTLSQRREKEPAAHAGALSLYAQCIQFLRSVGINPESPKFLATGRADKVFVMENQPAPRSTTPPAYA